MVVTRDGKQLGMSEFYGKVMGSDVIFRYICYSEESVGVGHLVI